MCQSIKTLVLVIWSEVILPIPCEDTRFEGQLMPYPSGCQQGLVLILVVSPAGQPALHMPPPTQGWLDTGQRAWFPRPFFLSLAVRAINCSFFSHTSQVISLPLPFLHSSSKAQRKRQTIEENKTAKMTFMGLLLDHCVFLLQSQKWWV